MKKYCLFVVLALSVAFANAGDKVKWTGFISASEYVVKGHDKDHAYCAKKCLADGADHVLGVG